MKKKKLFVLLSGLCALVTVCCLVWLVRYFVNTGKSENRVESLRESYVSEPTEEKDDLFGIGEESSSQSEELSAEEKAAEEIAAAEAERKALLEEYAVPEKEIDFAALQEEQNADIYAWITIPDTAVDYPVLQHPEELDYYLEYNMDGSKGLPGCLYTQLVNSKDFTDGHTVIYGHNMKNGSMFANLHYYEDSEFFESHPYLYVYTEDEILVYRTFAAYEFPGVHLLFGYDISTPENFESYIKNIFNAEGINNHFDESVEQTLTADSRILTLSTCISGKADKRWLVTGVLEQRIRAKEGGA